MNRDDAFRPESVEEQIDQFTYSQHQQPLPPSVRVIQQLHAHYEADQRSTERMWERLTQHMAQQALPLHTTDTSRKFLYRMQKERISPMKLEISVERASATWHQPTRFATIAAVLFTTLLVGGILLVLQAGRASKLASQPLTSPVCSQYQNKQTKSTQALYLSQKGEIEKIDPQTCATVWHTAIPSKQPSPNDAGQPVVIGDTIYLASANLFALAKSNGHILWSHEGMNFLSVDKGVVYAQDATINATTLYALNPVDGAIKATYKAPTGGWNAPLVADGVLYDATSTDLTAFRLSNKKQVWHQPLGSNQNLVHLQAKNGILYVQVSATSGNAEQISAFDIEKGTKLWEFTAEPKGVRTFIVTDTTIYIGSFNTLNALNARTGKMLWHQTIAAVDLLATQDTLYINALNQPLKEGMIEGAAIKISDGTFLWRKNMPWQVADSPLGLQNGVLYTASNDGTKGEIDAFRGSDGTLLWRIPVKGNIWQVTLA